jgi:hypothetical protein
MVSLVPFSTAWVADTKLAAVSVFVYAAVFVLVNLAYIPFEWHALAWAPIEEISTRKRRFVKARSSFTLATFFLAMLVSLKAFWGFGLVCCACSSICGPNLQGLVMRTLARLLRAVLHRCKARRKLGQHAEVALTAIIRSVAGGRSKVSANFLGCAKPADGNVLVCCLQPIRDFVIDL